MRVVITGATGFIGRALCRALHRDYEIVALSRNIESARKSIGDMAKVVQWDAKTAAGWAGEADGALAVINLAGENVASGRWNKARKSRILQSRLDATNAVIETIKQLNNKPKAVIQASAIGWYGPRRDEQLDEASTPGKGFLASVCRNVESSAEEIERLGVRCVVIRTGVVLGWDGGAFAKLVKPFRIYLGGYLGSGRQWFSWIHLEDEIAAIKFLMENEHLKGVFNLTAPQPVTMKEFCKILGKVLHRPARLNVPAFAARLAFGEMADEMLLSGQKVLPKRLLNTGFDFKYTTVEQALNVITR
ncbi:MAG TPA: TIGR01777 family oxidoreductase [Sedimentisphaerales bacterium]|nr:TIGR01777 family oxidoreductase [Sedimentisphaerales bacterium]